MQTSNFVLSLEHHTGFEPVPSAWKAEILATILVMQMKVHFLGLTVEHFPQGFLK